MCLSGLRDQQQILRLEVAVDHAEAMHVLQREHHLPHHGGRVGLAERPAVANPIEDLSTLSKLQHEHPIRRLLEAVEQANNMLVQADAVQDIALTLRLFQICAILINELDRISIAAFNQFGSMDRGERALTEQLAQLVLLAVSAAKP